MLLSLKTVLLNIFKNQKVPISMVHKIIKLYSYRRKCQHLRFRTSNEREKKRTFGNKLFMEHLGGFTLRCSVSCKGFKKETYPS